MRPVFETLYRHGTTRAREAPNPQKTGIFDAFVKVGLPAGYQNRRFSRKIASSLCSFDPKAHAQRFIKPVHSQNRPIKEMEQ